MSRLHRQYTLREILASRPAVTQEELVESLAEAGLRVTQATVSRDLAAIGAVRGPGGYRLADPASAVGTLAEDDRVEHALREHAMSVSRADALVVVRTAPGHANVVAAELDAARPEGMVGCIAGDDTIFIATPPARQAGELARDFLSMIEGE